MDIFDWLRALAALALTLGLIGAAAYGARRFGMVQTSLTGQPRRLRVQERLMLDPRRSVVIVTIDGADRALLLSPFGELDLGVTVAIPSQATDASAQEVGATP